MNLEDVMIMKLFDDLEEENDNRDDDVDERSRLIRA
jgi:hypothetical protein